jgi:Leucine-rich repeat (LRR) protein
MINSNSGNKRRVMLLTGGDDDGDQLIEHQHYSCLPLCTSPLRLNESSSTSCNLLNITKENHTTTTISNGRHRQSRCHHNPSLDCVVKPANQSSNIIRGRASDQSDHLVSKPPPNCTSIMKQRQRQQSLTHRLVHNSSHCLFTLVALLYIASFVNLIESSPDTQVNSCPLSACMCKWSNGKQGASCERRNLRTIPTQLPSETQVLDMSGNQLSHLPSHIFQERRLTNLQKLFLSDCKISKIDDEAFAQLTNLVELDLSHNHIQQIPTKPLEALRELRKLSLAFNQIHIIDSGVFSPLSRLSALDLTHSQVTHLKPNAFSGLNELRELKLGENRLTQLPMNVLVDLHKNINIDLYANPWHCDCELRQSIEWMQRHQMQPVMSPACASPPRHKDIRWQNIKPEEFMCPPVILNKPEEYVVGAGSNVTLSCSARGSQPLTFVWFQDEKNLTVGTGSSNQNDPPPSTKLLEERRYEIQEELSPPNITTSMLFLMNLKLTDTSVFLCWVENGAGYTIGNFSLIVNDSPPANLGVGVTGSAIGELGASIGRVFGLELNNSSGLQIAMIIIILLVLLLAAAIVCLIVLKQISNQSNKFNSNAKSDIKSKQINGHVLNSNKFGQQDAKTAQSGQMFASSDDDGITDDEGDERSSRASSASGSQSSCVKNNNTRVLAAAELDGFIDYMRSGIINMDYHSMSPVIQFNNGNAKLSNVDMKKQQQQQQHHQLQQLTQMNHFPSASNASSQHAYYGSQQTNGTNSRATTLSDLSPSSGSANTSFSNTNPMMVHQQHQHYIPGNRTMNPMFRQQNMINCDLTTQQDMIDSSAAPGDYLNGYTEDPLAAQQMGHPMYLGPYHPSQVPYDPSTLVAHSSRPSSMAGRPELVQNVVFQDMIDQNGYPSGQQVQQYQMQDSPSGPFTHVL